MKRILCILLAVVILLSVAACGGKKSADPGNGTAAVNEPPKPEKPLEFSIIYDGVVWTKNNRDMNESEEKKLWDKISNTNIKFITPPHSDYSNKLNIMLASGDIPDVVVSGDTARVVETESIAPLDDYMKKLGQPLMSKLKDSDFTRYRVSGNLYGIPILQSLSNMNGFIFRQDWLDNLGLKEPETLEEYTEVLKAFTNKDPDKNGKKDTYGGTFRSDFSWMNGFLGSFGLNSHNSITYDVADGKLVAQQTQEKYKNYLAYMRSLWTEKVFTPNSFVNTSDQWKKEIFTGIAGMWWHQNTRIDEYFMTQFEQTLGKNSGVTLVATKPPVGKDGKRGSPTGASSGYGIFINKNAKDVERIFKYFVWVFSNETVKDFAKYGIEGKTYKTADGKKQWIPEALTNDSLLMVKEMAYLESKYPIDDEEIIARYGQRALDVNKQNEKYNLQPYEIFEGKPTLSAEKDYPDQDKILMEYTVKMITGEMPLEKFDEMVKRLKDAGLDKVTADRQAWYDKNRKGK